MIRLDKKPTLWENRAALFCAYLIDNGTQSQTVKSYLSAIKSVLKTDGYNWCDNQVLFESLTQACKLINDKVRVRLPIQVNLLEMLLFELQRYYAGQPYLEHLYKAVFAIMYYGLMRIGEVAQGTHTVKAKDIHIGRNKDKILIILYSSKTHSKESLPQKIRISALDSVRACQIAKRRFFCPFKLIRNYAAVRGGFNTDVEPFFIFSDGVRLLPRHVRSVLRTMLSALNLDPMLYNTHSLRAGRSCDMFKA